MKVYFQQLHVFECINYGSDCLPELGRRVLSCCKEKLVKLLEKKVIEGDTMSWGMHTYSLLDRIQEIEKAMENSLWQSALAMALTIPDICGQIEFSYMVRQDKQRGKPKRLVGPQYKAWFSKYVEHYYADETGYKEDWTAKRPYFNAEMCWQLRNAFLHSGSDNIDINNSNQIYRFHLRVNSCDSIAKSENGEISNVNVDVGKLCHSICDSGAKFYNTWVNREDFIDRCCKWLDLEEWGKCYHKYNK